MDISNFIFPLLKNSPKFKNTIEGVTGQPIEYVFEKLNNFIDELGKGPGIVDQEKVKRDTYEKMYECGLSMGFKPWESEIASAGIAGYTPVEIAVTINQRNRRNGVKWTVTAEEIEEQGKSIAPRFKEAGIKFGLFPSDRRSEGEGSGIPDLNSSDGVEEPPWKSNGNGEAKA